jgi:hypothetical protein
MTSRNFWKHLRRTESVGREAESRRLGSHVDPVKLPPQLGRIGKGRRLESHREQEAPVLPVIGIKFIIIGTVGNGWWR